MYYVPDGTKECGFMNVKMWKPFLILTDNEPDPMSGM